MFLFALPNKQSTGFDEICMQLLKNGNKPFLNALADLMTNNHWKAIARFQFKLF